MQQDSLDASQIAEASLDVANSGQRDGEEVVRLYARALAPRTTDPRERLVAFERVAVPAGGTVHITLRFAVDQLRNWDPEKQAYAVPAGRYLLAAGASSSDLRSMHEWMVQ